MPLGEELLTDSSLYTQDLVKNISHFTLTCNINDICRVCLVPTVSKKNSNLFFASGRSIQLWAKVMACAWVQVFEGDGLPSQICYKCHNKLDIAYQFKQQCEAADAQIRQFLNRTVNNKTTPNTTDLTQNPPECLAECKPLNFNITSECLDLVQSDLSLSSYRLINQEVTQPQQIDFRLRDSDLAALKQEPGFITNVFNSISLSKNDSQVNSSFKCENYNENDIILDNLPAKLFETVNETINQAAIITIDQNDPKFGVWDLHNKNQTTVLHKDDFIFNADECNTAEKDKEVSNKEEGNTDIAFLSEERTETELETSNMIPDVCSDSSMDIDNECSFGNNDTKTLSTMITELPVVDITSNSFDKSCEEYAVNEIPEKNNTEVVIKNNISPNPAVEDNTVNTKKKEDSDIQCEHCGKLFKYRSFMIQHLRIHTGLKPYKCVQCNQEFTKKTSLVIHFRTHSGQRPFMCTICGKGFKQSNCLKSHIRSHTGEKPYECEICTKRFSQKSNLLSHKRIHSGQRNHICTICHKAFKFFKHLQSHKQLHSDMKRFKCSVCQKGFHRKSYLNIHLAVHSGEKPFKCEVCERGFSNSSNLRAHGRIHSGTKPYGCEVCGRNFTQSSALNRHMQQHTSQPTTKLETKD